MIPYDIARIKKMFKQSDTSTSKQEKGKIFEDLSCYLFETIPGVLIAKRNSMNQYGTEEVDISIWNDQVPGGLNFLNNVFLIECKNWSKPVTSIEVNWFATKVENRGLDFGILLAVNGITNDDTEIKNAQSILTNYLRKRIQIIVLTKKDILGLNTTDDMVLLIKNKICELVVNG